MNHRRIYQLSSRYVHAMQHLQSLMLFQVSWYAVHQQCLVSRQLKRGKKCENENLVSLQQLLIVFFERKKTQFFVNFSMKEFTINTTRKAIYFEKHRYIGHLEKLRGLFKLGLFPIFKNCFLFFFFRRTINILPSPKISISQAWKKLFGVTNLTKSPGTPLGHWTGAHWPSPTILVRPHSWHLPVAESQTETKLPVSLPATKGSFDSTCRMIR